MKNNLGYWGERYLQKELTPEEEYVFELRKRFRVRFGKVYEHELQPYSKNDSTRWSYRQPGRGLRQEDMWGGEIEIRLPEDGGSFEKNMELAKQVHLERCIDYPEIFALPPGREFDEVAEWRRSCVADRFSRRAVIINDFIKWTLGYVPVFSFLPLFWFIIAVDMRSKSNMLIAFIMEAPILLKVTPIAYRDMIAKLDKDEKEFMPITQPPDGRYKSKNKEVIRSLMLPTLGLIAFGIASIVMAVTMALDI